MLPECSPTTQARRMHCSKLPIQSYKKFAVDKLGKDWHEKGLLNVPSFYTESSDGTALGHMLWLHNCLKAFGMYEFAKDRYEILEGVTVKWKKKSFEDNKKKCL